MSKPLPSHARVVIIGGGVIGCSIAYHLTKIGITNVVGSALSREATGTAQISRAGWRWASCATNCRIPTASQSAIRAWN